jgi:hypothetical protein
MPRKLLPGTQEWLKVRGMEIKGSWLIIPSRCEHLGYTYLQDGSKIASCLIQSKKPRDCAKAGCTKS